MCHDCPIGYVPSCGQTNMTENIYLPSCTVSTTRSDAREKYRESSNWVQFKIPFYLYFYTHAFSKLSLKAHVTKPGVGAQTFCYFNAKLKCAFSCLRSLFILPPIVTQDDFHSNNGPIRNPFFSLTQLLPYFYVISYFVFEQQGN